MLDDGRHAPALDRCEPVAVTATEQARRFGRAVLQANRGGHGAERSDRQCQHDDHGGKRHGEFSGDGSPIIESSTPSRDVHAQPASHCTVNARRTSSVRIPRTSSLRMMMTSSPAKATAAIVAVFRQVYRAQSRLVIAHHGADH